MFFRIFTCCPFLIKRIIFLESSRSPSNGSNIWTSKDEGETFSDYAMPEGVILEEIKVGLMLLK